jgi:uncharacterized protein (DUF362 family)
MEPSNQNQKIAVVTAEGYPSEAPYHPSQDYPEYPFKGYISQYNPAYDGIRRLLWQLGLDHTKYNTPEWNPLGDIIKPGMTVVIKPNFVLSFNRPGKDLYAVITHPSVLRAIADYCYIALKNDGKIIIADTPQYNCNFKQLLEATRLLEVVSFYSHFKNTKLIVMDLRGYWSVGKHFPSMCRPLTGDPSGFVSVNLADKSALYGKNPKKFYGAVYHRKETIKHHQGERHEYHISRTMMEADVLISIPKLKVHKKVGTTLNIKGLVGSAVNKNLLVHYTLGTPCEGGDQFPDGFLKPHENFLINLERTFYDTFLSRRFIPLEYLHRFFYAVHARTTRKLGLTVGRHKGYRKRMFDAGNWYGNDTCWRMSADLAKVFFFADKNGKMHTNKQRAMFTIIDGIIGGQGDGPLEPDAKNAGILIGGDNFLAADVVATRLMGYNPFNLKIYAYLLSNNDFDFGVKTANDIDVLSEDKNISQCLHDSKSRFYNFEPHPGWKGYIEVNPKEEEKII